METHSTDGYRITRNLLPGIQSTSASYTDNPVNNSHTPSLLSPLNDNRFSVPFIGRETYLKALSWVFAFLDSDVPRRCALYGNKGVGKSLLAYKWAKGMFDQGKISSIFWISAANIEKLDQGFSELLHRVHHEDCEHPVQSVRLAAAQRWLETTDSGNWLLILDNVSQETLNLLREYLPRQNGRGSILFTARTKNLAVRLAMATGVRNTAVEVSAFDAQEAAQLLQRHFDEGEINASSMEIEGMATALECLPLAISHVALYMRQSRRSVQDILQMFRSSQKPHVRIFLLERYVLISLTTLASSSPGEKHRLTTGTDRWQ